jgi:predicted nucleotidyltransferase
MDSMETAIKQALHIIETQKQVRILYACESGSRAWGFASHDSDYDVRFLYVHPASTYLRMDSPRDVIERPIVDDLDINGWDIFKALRLLRKSNPPLLEWLFSPIVYLENSTSIEDLRKISRQFYYVQKYNNLHHLRVAPRLILSIKKEYTQTQVQ